MNIIEQLELIYSDINERFINQEFEARSIGDQREEEFQDIRLINDHAYFLLAFTRLEDKIKTVAGSLIDEKANELTSLDNKGWIILKRRKKADRLTFLEYVELITMKGDTSYNMIYSYYQDRNIIAHGGFLNTVEMSTAFHDFKMLFSELKDFADLN